MTNRFFKWILRVLGLAAVGCTVTACYGCPYGDYEIKGRVVDQDLEPIEGILVTSDRHLYESAPKNLVANGKDPVTRPYLSSAVTDSDGCFLIETDSSGPVVYAIDYDGEANGGEFEKAEQPIEFTQLKKGDNGWYAGSYTAKDVLIVMKPVAKDIPASDAPSPDATE